MRIALAATPRILRDAWGVTVWTLETLWLGAIGLWRLGRLLRSLRAVLSLRLRCPRGHAVAAYGVWRCGCGAIIEGWAFRACPLCKGRPDFVPCRRCNLSIRSPLQ